MRLALLALLLLGRQPAPALPAARPAGLPDVLDGDTLRLSDGVRLRLSDVDAPEVGRPFAEGAAAYARAFLAGGPAAVVPAQAPVDRYGRRLADLSIGGRSLSASLVAAGLAWVYRSDDAGLRALQKRAVEQRLGAHALLDHPSARGPFMVTTRSFHRVGCWLVRRRATELPVVDEASALLAVGQAPCRRCLAWPPGPSLGPMGDPTRAGR